MKHKRDFKALEKRRLQGVRHLVTACWQQAELAF